jgi:hypothetical protein
MASASAIGTLVSLAGAERVAVTVGTGVHRRAHPRPAPG